MNQKRLFWGGFIGALIIIIIIIVFVSLRDSNRIRELGEFYSNWSTTEGKVGLFSAYFPKEPEYTNQELPVPDSDQVLKQDIFVSSSDTMSFFIATTRYPQKIEGDIKALSQSALDGMAGSISEVSSITSKFVTPFREPYDYLQFEIKSAKNKMNYQGNIYIIGDTLYQIYASYTDGSYNKNEYDYFVKSFTIYEQ